MPSHKIFYTHFMWVHSIIDLRITHYPHGYSHALAPSSNVNVLHTFTLTSYALNALHHITQIHFNPSPQPKIQFIKFTYCNDYFSSIAIASKHEMMIFLHPNLGWNTLPPIILIAGIHNIIHKSSIDKIQNLNIPNLTIKNLMETSLLMPSNTTHICY